MMRVATAGLVPLLLMAALPATAAPVPAPIAAAVADAGRPEADKARDANRKPGETLAFVGVKPGMIVAELAPGGGYYTRLLGGAVGPKGRVLAIVTAAQAARADRMAGLNAIAAAHPNVQIVTVPQYAGMTLPQPADLFWTTENYHDFHNGPTADIAGLNKAVYANLKPGGIFFVEDHSSAPGAGLAATSSVHRMDEAVAKQELAAAGFKMAGQSELLRNPADNRAANNSESGHFSSDRFMLKARK